MSLVINVYDQLIHPFLDPPFKGGNIAYEILNYLSISDLTNSKFESHYDIRAAYYDMLRHEKG